MDIGELLSYKPPNTPKRPLPEDEVEDENETDYERQRKIRKLLKAKQLEAERIEAERIRRIKREEEMEQERLEEEKREAIMKMVENNVGGEDDVVDESSLKKMLLAFEKRALKNREMRIKFPDNPEKFMESEVELNEILQEMHVIATVPHLYPVIVQLNSVSSLLELLSHENTDIAVAVIDLLQELTDVDILHEEKDGADSLVDALLSQQACALLVQNLERMDETVREEQAGVHNTLAIFENAIEFRPDVVRDVASQGLMGWLLKRLRAKMPFDANKLYASEMLSILLQNCAENQAALGEMEGIDALLQQLTSEYQ